MKSTIGALLALGLLSTSASAWYCPPGYNSGYGHTRTYGHGHGYQKPTSGHLEKKVIVKPAPETSVVPPPAPEPEPVPQK